MPRGPRVRSRSGIYHIMLRGLDKRDIFLDDEDRRRFIGCIERAQEAGEFDLYGYCLMDNHVHLLLRENEDIGTIIKRITVGYVGWHNRKYERVGHLFQNRFLSEPVESEGYLLTVLRYIHQNPVKAFLVRSAKDYNWSSYTHYLKHYKEEDSGINGEIARSYFPTVKSFEEYMNENNDDECLEYRPVVRQNDESLRKSISDKFKVHNINQISTVERDELIQKIYETEKASIRQLSRVLGVGKTIIENAAKKDK
ncbi:MAG: transposase [Bacillota bacterium]